MKRGISLFGLTLCLVFGAAAQDKGKEAEDEGASKTFNHFRIGGYGEMLYQHMDYYPWRYGTDGSGAASDNRSEISIPRFILAFDYKFRHDIVLTAEIEFEYGGTGAGIEHEYTESGEYETEIEKAGEVAMEQFHITKYFSPAFGVRAGHMIVPLGLTNTHHEPINYFGAARPEGEMTLIPCTWHETGLAFVGTINDFAYQAMVINGLDPNGFDTQNWIRNGRQTRFEITNMTNPAFAARVDYSGVKNLRMGLSGYYAPSTGKNASNPNVMKGIKGAVTLVSADAQYKSRDLIARANVIYGNVDESSAISYQNARIPKATGFKRTPVAQNALTYFAEAGYNVGSFFGHKADIFPFIRFEYLNSQQHVSTGQGALADPKNKLQILSAGVNYFLLPNLVVKADYAHRKVASGDANSENTLSVGIAYIGWFFSN